MYVFVFLISAFGIVWYGIVMYFTFLLMATIAAYQMETDATYGLDAPDPAAIDPKRPVSPWSDELRLIGGFVILFVVGTFFVRSTLLDGLYNLVTASDIPFKAGQLNQEQGVFSEHPDYFTILSVTNLTDPDAITKSTMANIAQPKLREIVTSFMAGDTSLPRLEELLTEIQGSSLNSLDPSIDPTTEASIKDEVQSTLQTLYTTVLYPPKELENNAPIYRIGTFLSYFITNSPYRFYEDNLIFNFNNYFRDDADVDTAVDRMKKSGLKYLLVDLNAATIDKDPRHVLTDRYEGLLRTFRSKNLELIQTDNLCLRVALEDTAHADDYMTIAGVNYDSYGTGGTSIPRGAKMQQCQLRILDLINNHQVDKTHFSYLLSVSNYLDQKKPQGEADTLKAIGDVVNSGWVVLFRIK